MERLPRASRLISLIYVRDVYKQPGSRQVSALSL